MRTVAVLIFELDTLEQGFHVALGLDLENFGPEEDSIWAVAYRGINAQRLARVPEDERAESGIYVRTPEFYGFTQSAMNHRVVLVPNPRDARGSDDEEDVEPQTTMPEGPMTTFVLRVWTPQGEQKSAWRGIVERVHDGKVAMIETPEQLIAFMRDSNKGSSASAPNSAF
jgi:hypothetical protein